MITGVVVALPEELSTLTDKKIAKGQVGQLNETVLVIYSGAGGKNAHKAAELLVENGARQLISWGCAAALDPAFQSGDLILADSYVDAELGEYGIDDDWLRHARKTLAADNRVVIRVGKIVESKCIVGLSQDKARLAVTTGGVALDMESVAIAKVAQSHQLPFLTLRVIADSASMDLPKAVSHALNEQGEVELSRLLMYLCLHPTELTGLIKLGLSFNAAKKTLKRMVSVINDIVCFGVS